MCLPGRKDRNTNDFCSALALDACCMQRPMRRKVRWSSLLPSDTHTHTHQYSATVSRPPGAVGGKRSWSLLTCAFFSFLHEYVVPGDEGDQDGSLYFLLSRSVALLAIYFFVLIHLLSVRIPLKKICENKRNKK